MGFLMHMPPLLCPIHCKNWSVLSIHLDDTFTPHSARSTYLVLGIQVSLHTNQTLDHLEVAIVGGQHEGGVTILHDVLNMDELRN